jgi:tetratricopeptide (TPR) repeat protein
MIIKPLWILPLLITLQIHPSNSSFIAYLWHVLSVHYQKDGNLPLALEYRNMALEAGDPEALVVYGAECAKNGDIEKARECVNKLPSDYKHTAYFMQAILDDEIERAMHYARTRQTTHDADEYSDNWMFLLGRLCVLMEKYSYAERCYKKALEWDIGASLYTEVGKFYRKCGKLDHAALCYKTACERKEAPRNRLTLGKIYYQQGKFDLARVCIEGGSSLGSEAHGYLALIYKAQGNDVAYRSHLKKIDPTPLQTIGSNELFSFIKKQRRLYHETFWLKELVKECVQTGQFEEALPHLLRIVEVERLQGIPLEKLDGWTLWMLAKSHYKLGNFDEAEKLYKIIEHSTYPIALEDALYGLGKIAEYKKEYTQAEGYYQRYLEKGILKKNKVFRLLINLCKKQGKAGLAKSYHRQLHEELAAQRQQWSEQNRDKDELLIG